MVYQRRLIKDILTCAGNSIEMAVFIAAALHTVYILTLYI
jgi:hypothetical protein